ncbi:MAG: hypothetical protein ACLRFH_04690 [Opitutales bacterium]
MKYLFKSLSVIIIIFNFIACSIFAEKNEEPFGENHEKIWDSKSSNEIFEKDKLKLQIEEFKKHLNVVTDKLSEEALQRVLSHEIILGTTYSDRQGRDCTDLLNYMFKEKLPQEIEIYLKEKDLYCNKKIILDFVEAFCPENEQSFPCGMTKRYYFGRFDFPDVYPTLCNTLVNMFTAKRD